MKCLPLAAKHLSIALGLALLVACHPSGNGKVSSIERHLSADELATADMAAHWIRPDLILLPKTTVGPVSLQRYVESEQGFRGVEQVDLVPLEGSSHGTAYPHLTHWRPFHIPLGPEAVKGWLQSLVVVANTAGEGARDWQIVSIPQLAGVLDRLYTDADNDANEYRHYGGHYSENGTSFSLWAPTANAVQLKLYDKDKREGLTTAMEHDGETGIWRAEQKVEEGAFYRYVIEVFHPASRRFETLEVTDPYSLSLSTDSQYSQVVDLTSQALKPRHWDNQSVIEVPNPEALVIYETHIGDFSGTDDSVLAEHRGKYLAFAGDGRGSQHFKALRRAGLNVVHLLPAYDLGSINEFRDEQIAMSDPMSKVCSLVPTAAACTGMSDPSVSLKDYLASLDPTGGDAQALIESIDEVDDYNWGYDPFHYSVPEGSYATDPEGTPRILEFRQMVQALHEMGFRVVMDVVYNHTFKAGLHPKSVLDKVVPGYYHRLDPISGAIAQSTCCDNTATEHAMMAKLMTDSLVVWARDYKIDGFRFDLMGHQPKALMLEARAAVAAVDPDTYFYGEGWNFGEVANNKRFVQASQLELGGTEIGTFTDRLRDAVRGGTDFDSGDTLRRGQGLASGLGLYPNELNRRDDKQRLRYQQMLQWLRLGLAGNLEGFALDNNRGESETGAEVDYNGQPAGYAKDPADTINYVSKHDNQTLWDAMQYRLPTDYSLDERVRLQMMALSYPLLAQGIPFLHMGSDLLRSKSFLRDSFNYGHWFNAVDFSYQRNNYGIGLPPAAKDKANWPMIADLMAKNAGRDIPRPEDISRSAEIFRDFLAMRTGSPLFSLATQEQIIQRVKFHNGGPGHVEGGILMSISDSGEGVSDLDPQRERLVIAINTRREPITLPFAHGQGLVLHRVQASGADEVVKRAEVTAHGIVIPALTTAVFEQ